MMLLLSVLFAFQSTQGASPVPVYVPERVYDTHRQVFSDFERMLADLSQVDVIFVGEQHDDPYTHQLEAAMLDGFRRRGIAVTVALEMFERDAQPALDAYLAGTTSEEEFLKASRPWPRYSTDYRPLVEMAKTQGWPVLAANVPRRHAAAIAKTGRSALDGLSPSDRQSVARDLQCPNDAYFDRFTESMASHAVPGSAASSTSEDERRANLDRYYLSQCVKDETMAESIAASVGRGKGPIVHFNGSFHSDFGQGTAERVRRRVEGRRIAIVSILPVKDIDAVTPNTEDLRRADYLVYTVK
jgi:uncharacterized iron-regulated protein